MVAYYTSLCLLVAALFLFRFINGKRLGRVLRMAPEKHEAFAAACGVDYKRARITIFLADIGGAWVSSAASMRRSIVASPIRSSISRPCCSGSP